MRLASDRIGIEFTTNEEYQVIVVDYINSMKVQVMFLDEHKHKMWTQWSALEKGSLKNPFHKSVCGVGYLGTDENGQVPKCSINGQDVREYQVWHNMIIRCYNEKFHEENPTYKNCTVCDRWKCYSNFLEDLSKIKGYDLWRDTDSGISLNKDIYYKELGIITDCKEYSLLTTRFITISDNGEEVGKRKARRVKCIETNIVYDSIAQASKETGLSDGNISQVCKGKRKSCGGFTWEYVE